MRKTVKKLGVFVLAVFWLALASGQDCSLPRADCSCDGFLAAADWVRLKSIVVLGIEPDTLFCNRTTIPTLGDVNCDGFWDASDLTLQMFCVISGTNPLGNCPIPNVRPTVPDPMDSVIIQSKIVLPLSGPCNSAGLKVQVYITNKDSITGLSLPFETKTASGDAYSTLSRPANCSAARTSAAVFNFLYPSAGGSGLPRLGTRVPNFAGYHSDSPDTFMFTGFSDPLDNDSKVPPNLTRTLFLEIKFDSVTGCSGAFEIDSSQVLDNTIQFVDNLGRRVPVNFVKGVVSLPAKGDMDANASLSSADVVLLLNCTYLGEGNCSLCFADVNCDGILTSADVVGELNYVFLGIPLGGCP